MTHFEPGPSTPPSTPVAVQPLAYSVPWQDRKKPGLINAIGVMCIVVACLSGLVSLMMGFQGFGFWMMSKFATGRSAAPITAPSGGAQSDEKLTVGDVGVADNTLRTLLNLDGRRLRELDKLLRTHGKAVFPRDDDKDGTPLTSASIRAAVKEYHAAPDSSGAAHFVTEAGAVDVFPDHATFTAADGTTTIDSSARRNTESTSSGSTSNMTVGATTTPGLTALSAAEVQKIIRDINRLSPQPLTAAQAATVKTQLSAPNQQLVVNAAGTPVANVTSQGTPQGTNLMIQFDGGFLSLGPQGQVVSVFSNASMFTGPNMSGAGTPAVLMIFEGFCSMAVAIYLLIVGIVVMRSSFKSPRLLAIYAFVKIPLALLAGVAVTWLGYEFMAAVAKSMPGSVAAGAPGFAYFGIVGAVLTVLGLAFPIGLLIALRSRTAREFFNTVTT